MVDRDSRVIAMDLLTGREVWNSDRLLYRELSAPASLGPYLVVADFEGYAYLLDKRDGSFGGSIQGRWRRYCVPTPDQAGPGLLAEY